jgi:hypothetical protein
MRTIIITEGQLRFLKEVENISDGKYEAIFVAGFETGYGTDKQLQYFKNGFGVNRNVAVFKFDMTPFNQKQSISDVLASNPKIPVFLFSAGAQNAEFLSSNGNIDRNKLYIIQPNGTRDAVKKSVDAAMNNNVPAKNVFVGSAPNVGKDIVQGATPTVSKDHFQSLTEVASKFA